MSPENQHAVLSKFHSGEVKIVVATLILDEGIDVSACNLIIKYNLGSTARERIQRAGRVRAKGGKSIFICLTESEAVKEYGAILTGHRMKSCIKQMLKAGPSQTKYEIAQVKAEEAERWAKIKEEQAENKRKLIDKHFNILCKTCERYLTDSNCIRMDGSRFCVVNAAEENIWNNLGITNHFKQEFFARRPIKPDFVLAFDNNHG